jgi:preprotein translocase subunit YajC
MESRSGTPQEVDRMGGAGIIIWILVFFGIFYFLAIRPQRRQKQAHQDMVSMLKRGDEVVTIGGMFGTVTAIGDDWVELEIAKRTRVRYLKRAVSSITSIEEGEEDEDEYIEAEEGDVIDETGDEAAKAAELEAGADEAPAEAADATVEAAEEEAPEAPEAPKV